MKEVQITIPIPESQIEQVSEILDKRYELADRITALALGEVSDEGTGIDEETGKVVFMRVCFLTPEYTKTLASKVEEITIALGLETTIHIQDVEDF